MNPWTFAESVSLIPVAACAFAFVGLYRRWAPFRPALPLLLFFALAIRWYFLVQFPNPSGDLSFDAESYKIVGSLVRAGKDVYANTDRHPYLPFQMYFMAAASWLGDNTGPHFFSWIRWPNILADLGITVLIYRSLLRLGRGESESFWFAFIWAVHPISIYTSVIHGQFDSVAVFFSLLSWYLARFWRGWTGAALGGVALGLAILDKTWPVILLPALVVTAPELRRRLMFLGAALVIPLVALGVYQGIFGTTMHLIELKVVNYGAVPDRYGFTYAFAHYLQGVVPDHWLPYFREHGRDILLASVVIVASVVVPRRDTATSCVALLATFLVFASGWGSQYLVWIVPFAIVARQRAVLAAYSAVATAALLVYYWGTCGYQCPGRLSNTWQYWEFEWVWPLAMVWLAREILAALWSGRAPDAPIVLAARSLIRGLRRRTGVASTEL